MVIKRTLPPTLKKHPFGWLLCPKWIAVHAKEQMFSVVCCGEPGSGKTSGMLSLADLIDRSSNDVPRFSPKRVAYNADQFFDLMNAEFPIGTAIVLDDAGLIAYSADALTREVKEISKVFQSFRHKQYVTLITLPVYTMLAKNVRQIAQNYAETFVIDYTNNQNILKFQKVQTNAKTGDSYFHSYMQKIKRKHYKFDITITDWAKRRFIRLDKPSDEIWNEFKRLRNERLGDYYGKIKEKISRKKRRTVAISFAERYKYVKENLDNFLNPKGEVSPAKIMLDTTMNIPESIAKLISSQLNEDIVAKRKLTEVDVKKDK